MVNIERCLRGHVTAADAPLAHGIFTPLLRLKATRTKLTHSPTVDARRRFHHGWPLSVLSSQPSSDQPPPSPRPRTRYATGSVTPFCMQWPKHRSQPALIQALSNAAPFSPSGLGKKSFCPHPDIPLSA